MDIVIYKQENGSVALMSPSLECGLSIRQIAEKDVPKGCEWKIVSPTELPTNNEYFDAWRYGWPITIDAREAHSMKRDKMRRLRDPILKKLDIEFMRRLEMGQDVSDIASRKRDLRDVTDIQLPEHSEGESVDDFSKRLSEFIPECLLDISS